MCIITPTASYSTHQDQYTPSSMERFSFLYSPFQVTEATVINITPVLANQTGKVVEVNSNYGYINFTLEKEAYEKTVWKNGARSLPTNNGKLFFFENEFSGSLSEIKIGDTVTFDVKHVKTSNKIIATSVGKVEEKVDEIDRLAKAIASQLASINCMQAARMVTKAETPRFTVVGKAKYASISELHHSHGVIDYPLATTNRVLFHASELYSTVFSELKIHDVVKFDLIRNNQTGKQFARGVEFIEAGQAPTSTGHFIDMQTTTPVLTATTTMIKIATAAKGYLQKLATSHATIDMDGTTVFLPEMALYNTHLTKLDIGDIMKFDVFFNTKNGKHIAKNAQLFEKVNALKKFGHFQFMEPQALVSKQPCGFEVIEKNAIANVAKVCKDYGLLELAIGEKTVLYFNESELVGTHITELRENQLMSFDIVKNLTSGKFIAKNVSLAKGVKTPVTITETPAAHNSELIKPYTMNLIEQLAATSANISQQMQLPVKSQKELPLPGSLTKSGRSSLVSSRRGSSFLPNAETRAISRNK